MLTRIRYWAGFVAAFGLISVGPAAAAEAASGAGSTKPSVSPPVKSGLADGQHLKGFRAISSAVAVIRRPEAVHPAGVVTVNSSKGANLGKAQPTLKSINAEKRPKFNVKVAAVIAVGTRPAEVVSKNTVHVDEAGPLPSSTRIDRLQPIATLPDNPLTPPGNAYIQARSLEGEKQTANAIPLYAEASRQGHSAASVRLMEIYAMGAEGVSRNYIAAVEFKRLAVQQGARLEYPPHR